jgi:hypothetical protein
MTVSQILQPYLSQAQTVLGVSGADQDITSPQWQKALHGGANGDQLMSLSDWDTTLRTDPSYGWDKSADAKNVYSSAAQSIAQAFGMAPSDTISVGSQSSSAGA